MHGLYMLDTNTASYIMSGRSPAARKRFSETLEASSLAISALSEAELLFGLQKKQGAPRLLDAFEQFRAAVDVLPWDTSAARAYGLLRHQLNNAGINLATIDMLLAAHASSLPCVFVTRGKAFQQLALQVPLENWAMDLA